MDDLHNLYPSPHIIRTIRSRRIRGAWNKLEILFGKSEWKRALWGFRCGSEDKIKMRLEE
jgi:hypothetical protein